MRRPGQCIALTCDLARLDVASTSRPRGQLLQKQVPNETACVNGQHCKGCFRKLSCCAVPLSHGSQAAQAHQPEEADEYKQTVKKLTQILEGRKGKYSFADIKVPLQSEEHSSLGAEPVVVAYRYSGSTMPLTLWMLQNRAVSRGTACVQIFYKGDPVSLLPAYFVCLQAIACCVTWITFLVMTTVMNLCLV